MIMAIVVFSQTGCVSRQTIAPPLTESPKSDFIKKLGIAYFENRTFFPGKIFEEKIQKRFIETVEKECSDLIVVSPESEDFPETLANIEPFGQIDNLKLSQNAKTIGLNAVAKGTLLYVTPLEKVSGVLMFKGSKRIVELEMIIEVFDTATGAKLLDRNYIREIEVTPAEFDAVTLKEAAEFPLLTRNMIDIAEKAAEETCDIIDQQPWVSFVTGIEGNHITISAGSDSGLKEGDVLDVYAYKDIIEGVKGQKFLLPGPKIGEIKLTKVLSESARSISVLDMGIENGAVVKPRQ